MITATYESIANAFFGDRMPCIIDNLKLAIGPVLVKQDRLIDRTDYVVTAMNDITGYICQFMGIVEYLSWAEETLVNKVMALNTRYAQCNMRITEMVHHILVRH